MHKVRKARWKTRGRDPGVWKTQRGETRGVENTGCSGEHGAKVENAGSKWKTRGLSGKHGVLFLSPKYEFPHYNPQHLDLRFNRYAYFKVLCPILLPRPRAG